MDNIVEGQTLWFVGNAMGNFKHVFGPVTVTKVGRKWADITGVFKGRIDVSTGHADASGYSRPGTCYESRLAWLNQEGADLAWNALRLAIVHHKRPEGLSFEAIEHVAQQLGLTLDIPQAKAP